MKFILFTGTIARVGGAQMYVKNKINYMRSLGWEVYVFSALDGPILINGLSDFKETIIPELYQYPGLVRKNKIIKMIMDTIGYAEESSEEILIESNAIPISCWAEIIAEKLKAKHFMFLLDEHLEYSEEYYEFVKFKFDRKEIAVIKEKLVKKLLRDRVDVNDPERYILRAVCTNVVEDTKDERFDGIDYSKFDYTFCSLGRLNKEYIPSVIEGFEKFALKHPEKNLCCIFIGDQPENFVPDMKKVITERLGKISNISLRMIGYVYPVPLSFFQNIDIGVATSGSASLFWKQDVVTISMDVYDNYPIGVLGYTTKNTMIREKEQKYDLDVLIEKILFQNYLKNHHYSAPNNNSTEFWFNQHFTFIEQSESQKEYYDVSGIKIMSVRDKMKRFLFGMFGVRNCQKIKFLINK